MKYYIALVLWVRGVRGYEYPVRLAASPKFIGNAKLGVTII